MFFQFRWNQLFKIFDEHNENKNKFRQNLN